ncbi:MAG: SusD/RagB family nutrient-binding outer membrane lipoprotein [Chitinophagaceae bacterium]
MKKQFNIFLFATTVMVLCSCSKTYLDVNTNPNSPTSTTPELVLPNALTVTASFQVPSYTFLEGWMGQWAPSGSYATGALDVASYDQNSTTYADGLWPPIYNNLTDYDYIEKAGLAENKPFYAAAAKIMKAYEFQQLVDMFNDVPYSQAFQGTGAIQPKYDKGQDVYDAITAQIDSAVTLMQRADAIAALHSDVLFDGDNASWVAFANTLKLRILMRQSQVSARQSVITSEIAKIKANGGGFLTTEAGVNPGYANNTGQQSPVYGYFITITSTPTSGGRADFWRAHQYTIDFCKKNNDPRYAYFYAPVESGPYAGKDTGNVLGSKFNLTTPNSSGIGSSIPGTGIVKSVNQPAILISLAESNFLQAEAVLRGWLSGDITTLFNSGVQASFSYLGAGDATTYVNQPGNTSTNINACTTTALKLNCIIRQKWMAMNGTTPFEEWCDYRRLGLPTNPPIPLSVSLFRVGNIPFRLLYPSSEYQTNAANVGAEGTIDPHTSKIWWMP